MSINCQYLCCFVAKRPYLDGSLYQLIYEHVEHTNKHGESCHGSTMVGLRQMLGSNSFEDIKFSYRLDACLGVISNSNHDLVQTKCEGVGKVDQMGDKMYIFAHFRSTRYLQKES